MEIFLFDSFGSTGLNHFIIDDDMVLIKNIFYPNFKYLENMKLDEIKFNSFTFDCNKYLAVHPSKIKKLSETVRGMFAIFAGIYMNFNKTSIEVNTIDDALQKGKHRLVRCFCTIISIFDFVLKLKTLTVVSG